MFINVFWQVGCFLGNTRSLDILKFVGSFLFIYLFIFSIAALPTMLSQKTCDHFFGANLFVSIFKKLKFVKRVMIYILSYFLITRLLKSSLFQNLIMIYLKSNSNFKRKAKKCKN